MNWPSTAALLGALGVIAGAFGAHALKSRLAEQALGWWQTGALYHLLHAVALLALGLYMSQTGGSSEPRELTVAAWSLLIGVIIFSGSLYAMALTDIRVLGAVTPIGGVALIIGWLAIAWHGFKMT